MAYRPTEQYSTRYYSIADCPLGGCHIGECTTGAYPMSLSQWTLFNWKPSVTDNAMEYCSQY